MITTEYSVAGPADISIAIVADLHEFDPEPVISKAHIGVRPHKEKINISKEIINKTRRAVAPYVARMNHTPLRGEQQATVL